MDKNVDKTGMINSEKQITIDKWLKWDTQKPALHLGLAGRVDMLSFSNDPASEIPVRSAVVAAPIRKLCPEYLSTSMPLVDNADLTSALDH